FKNVQEKLAQNEDYYIISRKEAESKNLIQNFVPNNVKNIVLFTESGYLLLTKTFEDPLSWKIQKELVKTYFRVKQEKISSLEALQHITNTLTEHDNKINILADQVENQMTIDSGQQNKIQKTVAARVFERLKSVAVSKDSLFRALYRDIRNTFGVPSYRDIKKSDYEDALNYIKAWIEKADLRMNL
ncbi:MAG: ORF6C domain-containing protein, partial [Fusobacteriales bacterium]|nr:ORF6C domain-containing protein [Fusobacteriales bacterium]